MMAHKHLHELLKEDQEPFHLKSYIADRRCQLKRPINPRTTLQVKKRKPFITESSLSLAASSKSSFCKHACFLSFHDSPADVRRSPFLDFPSPAKSPCKSQNGGVLLHVPARTAALLLEAAMRIQKQQQKQKQSYSRSKTQIKNVGFGLFGSIFNRLKDRNKNKKYEIEDIKTVNVTKKTILEAKEEEEDRRSAYEMGLSCSCNNSRLSSAGWSESNEEKSMDLESSSCCSRSEESSMEEAFASCEKRFCSSPLSPFRFALQRSLSSSGRRTPDFSSPAASPSRHNKEEKDKYEAKGLNDIEPEDEKEQCSPVSVLDPPFEEDVDDGHEGGDEDEYEDDYDDLECSYAIVQRAKQQLLDKLCRFEKLAELDPVELEKRMIEQMDEEDCEDQAEDDEYHKDDESSSLHSSIDSDLDTLVTEVFSESSFPQSRKIPPDLKRLVSDLLSEETNHVNGFHNNEVVQRVCNKLHSWKEVQSNTIDMMVQLDFRREFDGWKKYQEQVAEITTEIEHAVCMLLLEELAEELLN